MPFSNKGRLLEARYFDQDSAQRANGFQQKFVFVSIDQTTKKIELLKKVAVGAPQSAIRLSCNRNPWVQHYVVFSHPIDVENRVGGRRL